jgi:hypothetical protein
VNYILDEKERILDEEERILDEEERAMPKPSPKPLTGLTGPKPGY